jgi:hypothetical protein
MTLAGTVIAFGIRQVFEVGADRPIEAVARHFADHSQTLPRALARANDRAWQALGVALAGDGFLDQVKVLFASGDDKGIRERVGLFLRSNASSFEGPPDAFRRACLAELKRARKAGLLSADKLSGREVAQRAAAFRRHADPQGLVRGAEAAVSQVAEALAPHCPNLAALLRRPTPSWATVTGRRRSSRTSTTPSAATPSTPGPLRS